jgi:hypothetical protein
LQSIKKLDYNASFARSQRELFKLSARESENCESNAGVAQLVERNLAKVEVTSSSLVTRSRSREIREIESPVLFCAAADNAAAARVAKSVNAADLKSSVNDDLSMT